LKELYSNPVEVQRWILVENENLMPNIVNYPSTIWEKILKEIENGKLIKDSDKIKLLNDAFILSKSGELNISYVSDITSQLQLFKLFNSLKKENSFYIWRALIPKLIDISGILKNKLNDKFICFKFDVILPFLKT
jgi:hypothetical protein